MRTSRASANGALFVGLLGLLSCNQAPGTGQISLRLKDAAGDVQAAVVTISEINLQGSGGTTLLNQGQPPLTQDLVLLQPPNNPTVLVEGLAVPAGTYTQLRFVLTGAYIQVDNGDGTSSIYASSPEYATAHGVEATGSLQMPSMGESGLKVILPGNALTVPDGADVCLTADFDVSQSFGHLAGGSGQWVMHPVIKGEIATGDCGGQPS